jgi:hypothetical protein
MKPDFLNCMDQARGQSEEGYIITKPPPFRIVSKEEAENICYPMKETISCPLCDIAKSLKQEDTGV